MYFTYMCKICVSWNGSAIETQFVCLDSKSMSEGSEEKFCIIYRRLLIVGTECKCELLYQHENIELLGCNIPKYIKKKDTVDKCYTSNAIH